MCFSICAEIRNLISFEPEMSAHTSSRLGSDSCNRPTVHVSRNLLGKFSVRREQDWRMSAMIAEVEAYKGPRDRAAHTHGGRRTARGEPLYGDGGTVDGYLIYGMHWMLIFSTAGAGTPEGVLIRAVRADPGGAATPIIGPGRVCQYLCIDKTLSGGDATVSPALWLEDRGVHIPARRIQRGPRVGVDYAGPYWAARPWRFWIDDEAGGRGVLRRLKPTVPPSLRRDDDGPIVAKHLESRYAHD